MDGVEVSDGWRGVESGCWMVGEMVVQCLNCPKVGRMSVRGRRKGALPCATRL